LIKNDWSDKYLELSEDLVFVRNFEKFMKKLILMIRDSDSGVIKVDETIYNFIENYKVEKRKKNINKILRKKDI